jgi:hypothetical protein
MRAASRSIDRLGCMTSSMIVADTVVRWAGAAGTVWLPVPSDTYGMNAASNTDVADEDGDRRHWACSEMCLCISPRHAVSR